MSEQLRRKETLNFSRARLLIAFAVLSYVVTVVTTAFVNYRTLDLNGDEPDFGFMLLWQGLTYAIWIPVGAWLWRLFRRDGLTARAIGKYAILGTFVIPMHAVLTTAFDAHAASPGMIDLRSLAAQRAQLDILMYASFGVLALAAHFQRIAAEQRGAAEDLKLTLQTARIALEKTPSEPSSPEPLTVSVGRRRVPVLLHDVEFFGAAANYVLVNWAGGEGLIRGTLQAIEKSLNPKIFARAHRSTIVNLAKIGSAEALSDGSWRLVMSSGAELIVSRTYRDAILARLGHKSRGSGA